MKYLLCRPLAGLSDHFNTIQRCIEYSKKFNRILLIDSDYKSTYNFNFIDVFQLIDDTNIIYDSNKIREIISNKNLSIFPNEIIDLYNYSLEYHHVKCVIENTNTICQINFNKDYIEDIILHTNNGNGNFKLSNKFISNIKLTNKFINDIIEKYNKIQKPYISLHIRNTDRQCNYNKIYDEYIEKIKDLNIFLATDSIKVLNFFKSKNLKIYSFTELPDNNKPYHKCLLNIDEILLNTISDLFLLALGNDFIYSEENHGSYYKLAYYLYQNKDVLHNVLDNRSLEKPKKISLFKKR